MKKASITTFKYMVTLQKSHRQIIEFQSFYKNDRLLLNYFSALLCEMGIDLHLRV